MGESSNFPEAANLVIKVIRMVKTSQIKKGSEEFVCTNNILMEQTYTKGLSNSPKLHNLIIKLLKIIYFIWIPGTRMITQGSDALSRGAVSTSSMTVEKFLQSLPLNQTAFALQNSLRSQVEGWLVNNDWEFMDTKDFYHKVFTKPKGSWVWCPPPALWKIAVELLCEVKNMHPESRHVFLCPMLMEQQCGYML